MIDPVSLPKFGFETQVGLGDDGLDESLGRHSQANPPIEDCFQKLARREGLSQQRAQRLGPIDQAQHGRLALGWDNEAAAQHRQRVVAVGLDQPQKGQHLRVADRGIQQDVAPAILIDIAVAGVALRIELRGQVERVVVALQVAVPAAIQMVDVSAQPHRPAAAQDVVQQALPAVGVETRVAGLCRNGIGEALGQRLRLGSLGRDVVGLRQAITLAIDHRSLADMADDRVEGQGLARRQRRGRAGEAARRPTDGDLRCLAQLSQRVRQEAVGVAEGCVGSEDEGRVNDRRETCLRPLLQQTLSRSGLPQ